MDITKLISFTLFCLFPYFGIIGLILLLTAKTRIKTGTRIFDNLKQGKYRNDYKLTHRLKFLVTTSIIILTTICFTLSFGIVNLLYPSLFTVSAKNIIGNLVIAVLIIIVITVPILMFFFNKVLDK